MWRLDPQGMRLTPGQPAELTGAFVQNEDALILHGNQESALACITRHSLFTSAETIRRIWKLLETPQTVETICRVLVREYGAAHGVGEEMCQREVSALFREMLHADLIQQSPDS